MEHVKKHLLMIIFGVVVLGVSIWFFIWLGQARKDVETYKAEVDSIVKAEKRFIKFPWELSKKNVKQAEGNKMIAQEEFDKLLAQIAEKYPHPDVTAQQGMTPIRAKLFLRQACMQMENLLRGENVMIPENLKYFDFGDYMAAGVLPPAADIPVILKQLEIVKEIVYLISQSGVESVGSFERPDNKELTKRPLYGYWPFTLRVTGEMKAVQGLVNDLQEGKFCFLPHFVEIKPGVVAMSPAPVATRGSGGGAALERGEMPGGIPGMDERPMPKKEEANAPKLLPKAPRLVYRDKANVTLTVEFDYIEFNKKKTEE